MRLLGGEVREAALTGSFVPPSDQRSFLEIEITVSDGRRALPVFKDPLFLPDSILSEGCVDGLRASPGFQDLIFCHADHDAMLFDVFLKVRVAEVRDHGPYHHQQDKESEPYVNDDPDLAAANK